MTDVVDYLDENASSPARYAFAITPHATNEVNPLPRAVYVGTGGDVTLRAVNSGADVTFKNVPDGGWLDVRALHVRVAGTTASDLVGVA